jgi:predicted nuclease with TOPRIM domain
MKRRWVAYDAARDATASQFSEMSDRIQRLESKVDSLESENSRLTGGVADLKSSSDWEKDSVDRLFSNDRTFVARLGIRIQQ